MKMEKEYFKAPQKAAIKNGEKFLILKRSADAKIYPDYWDFPGGKLECGEDPKKGLKREVKEETGLEVEIKNPEFVFSEKVKDHFTYVVVFKADIAGKKEIQLSKEHSGFKWAIKEEAKEMKLENFLKAYFEKRI